MGHQKKGGQEDQNPSTPKEKVEFVRAKKVTLVKCLTCHLCSNLLNEATTIGACLHAFCKSCIVQKLDEDGTNCCPVCNDYLGCFPKEKLKRDNNLQELRMLLFPPKVSEEPGKASLPSSSCPANDGSLSPFDANTDHIISGNPMPKMAVDPRCSTSKVPDEVIMQEENELIADEEEEPIQADGTSKGPLTILDYSSNKAGEGPKSEQLIINADTENKADNASIDLLALPVFRTLGFDKGKRIVGKRTRRGIPSHRMVGPRKLPFDIKPEQSAVPNPADVTTVIGSGNQGGEGELMNQGDELMLAEESPDNPVKKLNPVWLSFQARNDQSADTLPQLRKCYIRIRDGDIPVSYVQRYLMEKLNLDSESEIEVTCCGQQLLPSATLNSLADIWVQHTKRSSDMQTEEEEGRIADPQQFVMVLTYRRIRCFDLNN